MLHSGDITRYENGMGAYEDGAGEELNRMNTVCFDTVYACHLFSYLPSHYITMTQFQYILIIFLLHGDLRQTKEAFNYVHLHIFQYG